MLLLLLFVLASVYKMSKARVAKKDKPRKRVHRATSNIFAMFDQTQIQEFKEAFNIIDQDRDGKIDANDLKEMLSSLGKYVCLFG